MRSVARRLYLVVAWSLVIGLVAQVFLAGLGACRGPSSFVTHRGYGYLLEALPLVLVAIGLAATPTT